MNKRFFMATAIAAALAAALPPMAQAADAKITSPLRVMLVPADGGTEDGTKADFQPIFNAITRSTGILFDIKVGQSYAAVVEAMCAKKADIAWFGPASYIQARDRGCAKLLAVAVDKGQSVYYSGLFTSRGSDIKSVNDTKGDRLALGDVNSTSSFLYPVAILLEAGVDPARDMKQIILTGSHANVLTALAEGKVDVGGASFDSFEKAAKAGAIDPMKIRVLAKSSPIPYPPITMRPELPASVQKQLKDAFSTVHQAAGITPDQIRGYGGHKVQSYDVNFPESAMDAPAKLMELVNDQVKTSIIKKASTR
ncbi:MAG: phosphate/phosphite/phosphonate ABC transporter substrate-binding protein [Sulfuriferula sp.]